MHDVSTMNGDEMTIEATDETIRSVLESFHCENVLQAEREFAAYGVTKFAKWERCRCSAPPVMIQSFVVRRVPSMVTT